MAAVKGKATNVIRQQNAVGSGAMPVPQWVDCFAVTTAAATYTVPTNISILRLTASAAAAPCFGSVQQAAVAPANNVAGTASFPIGATTPGVMFSVSPGASLSLIGTAAGFVFIEGWM